MDCVTCWRGLYLNSLNSLLQIRKPSVREVRCELQSILGSREFRQSRGLTKLLRYICSKALVDDAEPITEYTIAVERMIDWLRAPKAAYFYKKRKRLSKASITDLFRNVRQNSDTPSNNVFYHLKEELGHALWSAMAFFFERDPSFLDQPEGESRERVCGYLLLVEHRNYVAVFKAGLDLDSAFRADYLKPAGDDRVEAAIASADAVFEQIRLKNMATSRHALRSKTLEADNLEAVFGASGTSRYVAKGYRVRREGEHYTATPNTGRISQRADRAAIEELVQWAVRVIDMLDEQNATPSTFIRTFARPISLDSIPAGVSPTFLAIDVPSLTEQLFDLPESMCLTRRGEGQDVPLNKAETEAVLAALDETFGVRSVRRELRLIRAETGLRVGEISIGKTRISLRQFEVPEIENVYIQRADGNLPELDSSVPIKRYIDQKGLYTIFFSDFTIAYLDGALYRDESIADGRRFLSFIRGDASVNAARSEKGAFRANQTEFDTASLFRIVIDEIAVDDEDLVCDDLGDEWADLIGVNTATLLLDRKPLVSGKVLCRT